MIVICRMKIRRLFWIMTLVAWVGCSRPTHVALVGSIHEAHNNYPTYGLDILEKIVRQVNPQVVLAEVPPERFPIAWKEWEKTDSINEVYVLRFPEMAGVVFPLKKELGYDLYPVSGWTYDVTRQEQETFREMVGDQSRKSDWGKFLQINSELADAMAKGGGMGDPLFVHSVAYDSLIAHWAREYDKLFEKDLGFASWKNQNDAHWKLIAPQLDAIKGQGKTVAIVFSPGNRYYFETLLRRRKDIKLIDMEKRVREWLMNNG